MKRDLAALDDSFDAIVVGAGVTGVCLARALARSGWRVALLERDDFGGGTTHNSLKTLHGGLRYLQRMDLPRLQESVVAQHSWLRAAPHLVRPLRFTMATHGMGLRGPAALGAGALAYAGLSWPRNRGIPATRRLPGVALGGRRGLAADFPFLDFAGANGAFHWHDAQLLDSGRAITECVLDLLAHGGVAMNHVKVTGLARRGSTVQGVEAVDRLEGRSVRVRAPITVAATGPWSLCDALGMGEARAPRASSPSWTRNVNLVLRTPYRLPGAVALQGRELADTALGQTARLLFLVPWRDRTLLGTAQRVEVPPEAAPEVHEEEIAELLEVASSQFSTAAPARADVCHVHVGHLPGEADGAPARRPVVHGRERHGLDGYLEVIANKYTTAPLLAERVGAFLSGRRLRDFRAAAGFDRPLPGAPTAEDSSTPGGKADEFSWARHIYGALWEELEPLIADQDTQPAQAVARARVLHASRREGVFRLRDAVLRGSDLAERGMLDEVELEVWCSLLATEHHWDRSRVQREWREAVCHLVRHCTRGFTHLR